MKYEFKNWIGTSERAKVMEIIRYADERGWITKEVFDAHPDLQDYFTEVSPLNR